jgi:hypothetical protein
MRIDAVRGNDEIVILAVVLGAPNSVSKRRFDAELAGALLQQISICLRPMPQKPCPVDTVRTPCGPDGDVIPIGEMRADLLRADGSFFCQIVERLVGQHHAPAEGVVGLVALDHGHLVRGIAQLHRDREVKTGRTAAQTGRSNSTTALAFPDRQLSSDTAAAVDFHGNAGDHRRLIGTEETGGVAHVLGRGKPGRWECSRGTWRGFPACPRP